MSWDEFSDLISGLNEETPLVRIAQIRTESDPEAIKNFTAEQRAMRQKWQRRQALNKPEADTLAFLNDIEQTFARLFKEQ